MSTFVAAVGLSVGMQAGLWLGRQALAILRLRRAVELEEAWLRHPAYRGRSVPVGRCNTPLEGRGGL